MIYLELYELKRFPFLQIHLKPLGVGEIAGFPPSELQEVTQRLLKHGQLLSRAKPPEGSTGATTLAIAPRCHQMRRLKNFDKASRYGGLVVWFGKFSSYWLCSWDVDVLVVVTLYTFESVCCCSRCFFLGDGWLCK